MASKTGRATRGRVTVAAGGRRRARTVADDLRAAEDKCRSGEPDFLSVKFQTGADAEHRDLAPMVLT